MTPNRDFVANFEGILEKIEEVRGRLGEHPGGYRKGQRWTLALFPSFLNQVTALIPEFSRLLLPSQLEVSAHICHFLVFMTGDPAWQSLDPYDRNLLLWISLLHDIGKKVGPNKERDLLHPFESAAVCVELLQKWGWLPNSSQDLTHGKAISEHIRAAVTTDSSGKTIQDNRQLASIVWELLKLTGILAANQPFSRLQSAIQGRDRSDLFTLDILLLVLLHQSVTVTAAYPQAAPLDANEYGIYLNPRLSRLLSLILRCDSGSYSYVLYRAGHSPLQAEISASCQTLVALVDAQTQI